MKKYACSFDYLPYPRILVTEDFINENSLCLSRSVEEIIDNIKSSSGIFGFKREVLLDYLPWNNLTVDFLKTIFTEEACDKYTTDSSQLVFIEDIAESVQNFLDYMVFAWGKSFDERGLSASRSIEKLSAYLWLYGKDSLVEIIEDDDLYNPYGMPALIAVCEKMKIYVPEVCIQFANIKC